MILEKEENQQQDLLALVSARFEQSIAVPTTFFAKEAERIAEACWEIARRFHQGGRMFAFGTGSSATDAQHISVEFVHPVIMGKRALPVLALTNDSATLSGLMGNGDMAFSHQVSVLARPQDIALGFSQDGNCSRTLGALQTARNMKLLTLGLAGCNGGSMQEAALDFCFVIPSRDPLVIQETHETLYHILWELVHIFFEHEGLLQ